MRQRLEKGKGNGKVVGPRFPRSLVSIALPFMFCLSQVVHGQAQEPITLKGHKGYVRCVSISPDRKQLASGGEDGFVRIWDLSAKKEMCSLDHRPYEPDGVVLLEGTRTLVVAATRAGNPDDSGTLTWWDLEKRKVLRRLQFEWNLMLRASPDGRFLATSSGKVAEDQTKIWESRTGKIVQTLPGSPNAAAFSSNGELIAVVGLREKKPGLWVWETQTGKLRYATSTVNDIAVAFSPVAKTIISGSPDGPVGKLTFHDLTRERVERVVGESCGACQGLGFGQNGRIIVIADTGRVTLVDVKSGEVLKRIDAHESPIQCIALAPDGSLFATAGGKDETVRVWDLKGWE